MEYHVTQTQASVDTGRTELKFAEKYQSKARKVGFILFHAFLYIYIYIILLFLHVCYFNFSRYIIHWQILAKIVKILINLLQNENYLRQFFPRQYDHILKVGQGIRNNLWTTQKLGIKKDFVTFLFYSNT